MAVNLNGVFVASAEHQFFAIDGTPMTQGDLADWNGTDPAAAAGDEAIVDSSQRDRA
jgi:hypothetical protein